MEGLYEGWKENGWDSKWLLEGKWLVEGTWLWEAARLTFAVAHMQGFDIGNVEVQMKCLGMIAGEFSPQT